MPKALKHYQRDFISGVVVFLVAIPLCLGIALASGAPLYSGIVSGIVGGIITGYLSQSTVSVSGPAAGLVAIVYAAITQLGTFEAFLLSMFLAGIIQTGLGYFKAGFIADFFPSNVIQGLLAAIGILIIIKQLPLAFGYFAGTVEVLRSLREAQAALDLAPLSSLFRHINAGATLISTISLLILIFWDQFKNKLSFLKLLPAPVIVVIFGILMNYLYQQVAPSWMLLNSHLVDLPVNSNFSGFLSQFRFPDFSMWTNSQVYVYAILIAIVASLETLLNLVAYRKIDKTLPYASRNQELLAQGTGNIICGLLGGLPVTSVIVRSAVNIQAGGRSKVSTITHGFFLLFSVMFIPHYLNLIPLASLAAILIHTGYKLCKISLFKNMYSDGMEQFIPFVVTVIAIVIYNLLIGILIGLGVSFFFILRYASTRRADIIKEKHPGGQVLRMTLPQQISFLNKASYGAQLRRLPKETNVVLDASNTEYIDKDIIELFKDFRENQAPKKNISLNMIGFKDEYKIHNYVNFINVTTHEVQESLKPQEILALLAEGNQRFLHNQAIHRNNQFAIRATSTSQHPIAVILSCIDSRVPVEFIFDVGLGDIFTARVAGNVINKDVIASLEYACHLAGAKLILVLGHLGCGAINAAYQNNKVNGHVDQLLAKIEPAIECHRRILSKLQKNPKHIIDSITQFNVEHSMLQIYQQSAILRNLIETNKIGLAGGIYNIYDGTVKFTHEKYDIQTHKEFSKLFLIKGEV